MGTFFKTFFICMMCALAFFVYKYVLDDSYSNELSVSKDSAVFGLHNKQKHETEEKKHKETLKTIPKDEGEPISTPKVEKQPKQPQETIKKEPKKYTYICYFYAENGSLTPVVRELSEPITVKNAINLLLKGPTIAESKAGVHSEIPAGVDLIWVKNTDKAIIVNLTSNFGNGGGSESVENRLKQLSKTVKRIAPKKSVYLYINGSEVEYLGGEGVYVKQPLE